MKKIVRVLFVLFIMFIVSACEEDFLKLVDKKDYEINSVLKYSDLVVENEMVTLINKNELIDTSVLGEQKVVIQYLVKDKPKYKTITIKIVDTESPTIKYTEKLSTTKDKKIDLLKDVKVSDNSKENIKVNVIGEYDFNKVGTYKLKYSASDSSGNTTVKDFTLTVKSVSVKVGGYYVYKEKSYWAGVHFKNNNKVEMVFNYCPGSGCGGYSEEGTYSIEGQNVTLKLTKYYDEVGGGKLNKKFGCTIKSESKIVCQKKTFTWKNKFN